MWVMEYAKSVEWDSGDRVRSSADDEAPRSPN